MRYHVLVRTTDGREKTVRVEAESQEKVERGLSGKGLQVVRFLDEPATQPSTASVSSGEPAVMPGQTAPSPVVSSANPPRKEVTVTFDSAYLDVLRAPQSLAERLCAYGAVATFVGFFLPCLPDGIVLGRRTGDDIGSISLCRIATIGGITWVFLFLAVAIAVYWLTVRVRLIPENKHICAKTILVMAAMVGSPLAAVVVIAPGWMPVSNVLGLGFWSILVGMSASGIGSWLLLEEAQELAFT